MIHTCMKCSQMFFLLFEKDCNGKFIMSNYKKSLGCPMASAIARCYSMKKWKNMFQIKIGI